jgi:chaperonin GroEL
LAGIARFGVVGDANGLARFDQGVDDLVRLIQPAYGPATGGVVNAGATGRSAPEVLTDGATIARRVTEMPGRVQNVGAMFLRGLLWEVHQHAGDGTSTAAIVFDAIHRKGRRGIAAGLNAARLRHYLLAYAKQLEPALERQRIPVTDASMMQRLAHSVCGDQALSGMVAEVFAALGPHVHIEVRPSRSDKPGYEFLEGPFWPASCLDNAMLAGMIGQRLDLVNCAVFVSDLAIEDAHAAVALVTAARARQCTSLIIIGRSLGKQCLGTLMANSTPEFRVIAMRTPEMAAFDQFESMDDIAAITGAAVFRDAVGARAATVAAADLGTCRRAWATRTHIGLFGGEGDSRNLRARIRDVRGLIESVTDDARRKQLRLRMSRLTASSAILWVDGTTDREVASRKARAERTCRAVQLAIEYGALPGGGAALLDCARVVGALPLVSREPEEAFARSMIVHGLEAPARALARNGGIEPSVAVARANRAGPGHALDVMTGSVVDMPVAGVVDGFDVVSTAVHKAVAGAAQALAIDTIVLKQSPQLATSP